VRIRSFVALAVVVVALLFGSASLAFAQPVPWESVDIVIHDDQGSQLMIIAGQLATDTPLPAQVELAVPAGLRLQWSGEIVGDNPANDPTVMPKITKVGNSDIYAFTVKKSRTAQLELAIPGAVQSDGSKYAASVVWTPSQDVKELKIGFRIPAGAKIATPVAGAATVPGPTGFDYYRSTLLNVKAGKPVTFAFDYTAPAAAAAAGSTGSPASNGNAAAFVVIAVLGVVIVGLMFAVWRKMKARGADAPETSSSTTTAARPASKPAASGSRSSPSAKPPAAEPARKGVSKNVLIMGGVIAVLAIGAFFAIQSGKKPQDQGNVITRTFSSADPCTSTVVPLAVAKGGDMNDAAKKLFGVLQTLPSITTATIYKDQPRIEVGYCESSLKPGQVEQALAATGLVAKAQ
jgi:hypothetical protein